MEITVPLHLTFEEETLVDMHGLLNLMNVTAYELMSLDSILGSPPEIELLIEKNSQMAADLRDREMAAKLIGKITEYTTGLKQTLEDLAIKAGVERDSDYLASLDNINTVSTVLELRAAEITARWKDPMAWVCHDLANLKKSVFSHLKAIQQNSKGNYRIVHNIADQESSDYYLNFEINSVSHKFLWMPAALQDVVRDLIANARKYTPHGGWLIAGLSQNHERLRLVVSDTGIGIPQDEIEHVVQFGARGSNVTDRPTLGGGFGLTKAYYLTRKFSGRMWVDSSGNPGEGTRVTISIPLASEVKSKVSLDERK
jgi:signal transduction histidine kinase